MLSSYVYRIYTLKLLKPKTAFETGFQTSLYKKQNTSRWSLWEMWRWVKWREENNFTFQMRSLRSRDKSWMNCPVSPTAQVSRVTNRTRSHWLSSLPSMPSTRRSEFHGEKKALKIYLEGQMKSGSCKKGHSKQSKRK